jgi:hypothetical protein
MNFPKTLFSIPPIVPIFHYSNIPIAERSEAKLNLFKKKS